MCGIAGIVDLIGSRAVDQNALKRMTNALIHRGPDGEGYYFAEGIGLGHRRLAVIDKQGGAQPFHAQKNRGVLSYNGEIYNYRELAKALRERGVSFTTRSDTEVLAEGLARESDAYLQNLRGMFAFAFWSPDTRRLLLARDRLGEKPLYYAQTEDGFLLFASELGALLSSGLLRPEICPQAIADYFYYGYVPDPKTIYKNIHKLPAAHFLVAGRDHAVSPKQYWRPEFQPRANRSLGVETELLHTLLDEAVSMQTVSDAPLGLFLSGGVDSAAVLTSLSKTVSTPLAFTIGFKDRRHDESQAASHVAEQFGALHHIEETTIDVHSHVDAIARAFGEPFADTAAFTNYINAKHASRHVTVALSGDGGDELFAGYRRYQMFLNEERFRHALPAWFRQSAVKSLGAIYPKLDWGPRPFRLKTTLLALAENSPHAYAAAQSINLPHHAHRMLNPDLRRDLNGYHPAIMVRDRWNETHNKDALSKALYTDMMTWLPGRMLTKIDRTSMAHSLEMRPPMLDYHFVEWACRLPAAYKLRHGTGKFILKEALVPALGRKFVSHKKRGFDLPISEQFGKEENTLPNLLEDSSLWRKSGLLDTDHIDGMIGAHKRGASNLAQELWSVMMFDAFLRMSASS